MRVKATDLLGLLPTHSQHHGWKHEAVYYRTAEGSEPVNDFIDGRKDADKQATLDNQIERLNMLRPNDPPCLSRGVPKSRGSFVSSAATMAQSSTG